MTRFILFSAFGFLLVLGDSALGQTEPSPTPDAREKRFRRHPDRTRVEKSVHFYTTPTPAPNSRNIRTLVGEVGKASTAPTRTGPNQDVPAAGSTHLAPNPQHFRGLVGEVGAAPITSTRPGPNPNVPAAGGSQISVPNEYYEPEPPSAGPGFRSYGAPAGSQKTKSTSSFATSTPPRKIPAKVLIPSLGKATRATGEEANAAVDIDANPPAPSELGAPVVIPMIPRYDAVPRSKALYLPDGNAPIPVDYTPPTSDGPVQVSPTSLRAWNGEMTRETRTFDQTRVQVATGADDARRWQFFWRTKDAKPRAARWEISTVPFVDDGSAFPPPGLVAYGDAAVAAPAPAMENFFGVEFNSLAKHFGDEPMPNRFYLRVVPVDGSGHPAAQPSNWVRIDLP